MGNFCIFCDSNSSSKEHIFPSSFGGRLENGKIYCRDHNSNLGYYVDILDKQIGGLNNLFGIYPDRGEPKPIKIRSERTGEYYQRNIHGNIKTSTMDNINLNELIKHSTTTVMAAPDEDMKKLESNIKQALKKNKIDAQLNIQKTGDISQSIVKEDLIMKIEFGGEAFFKATLYLLITFLAHYNREAIDKINIKQIEDILLNTKNPDPSDIFNIVSIEDFPLFLQNDENQLTHTFAFIKNNNVLYGVLSYFNLVTYTVKISDFYHDFNNFAIYVLPLKESYNPNDMMIKEALPKNIEISFNPELHSEKLSEKLTEFEGEMSKKLNNIAKELSEKENQRLSKGINKNKEDIDGMKAFWGNEKQYIFNCVKYLANANFGMEPREISITKQYLDALIKSDVNLNFFIDEIVLNLAEHYLKHSVDEKNIFMETCIIILHTAIQRNS